MPPSLRPARRIEPPGPGSNRRQPVRSSFPERETKRPVTAAILRYS